MSGAAFNAVSVVDAPLSCFCIAVEVLQVVVEVDITGAKVSTEESCVCSKDSCAVDSPLLAKW